MTTSKELLSARCLVVDTSGNMLVVERPETAGHDLLQLEPPGGKVDVEAGETEYQAAVRECQEETGLVVEILGEPITLETRSILDGSQYNGRTYLSLGFFSRVIGGEIGTGSEQLPVHWLPLHDMATSERVTSVGRTAAQVAMSRLATL